jgi:hypothetical protein
MSGKAEIWLKRFEYAANENKWSNEKKLFSIRNYLEGSSAKWYDRHDEITDWSTFKNKFIKQNTVSSVDIVRYTTFKFISEKSNLMQFFEEKVALAKSVEINDQTLITDVIFNSNLPQDITQRLVYPMPKTVIKLKNALEGMAAITPLKKSFDEKHRSTKKKNKFHFNFSKKPAPNPCPFCAKQGRKLYHWLRDCRFYSNHKQGKRVNMLEKPNNNFVKQADLSIVSTGSLN